MNPFAIQTKYRLFDLIDFVVDATKKNISDGRDYFEYRDIFIENISIDLADDPYCFVDEPLDDDLIDEDENPEGYSDFVISNKLKLLYYGQQFVSVIENSLLQKNEASIGEIVQNLKFYSKHDTYMDMK
ncbi:Uncharacterised protein [Kingella potus]|uniref:DUF7716 domain-containing protein n=2 Tax=Kingella potus TaxID=265175 RepID=A0A377R4D1_9NEIS|nr:Uncharacterised protein [Kingella potus]